MGKRKSGKLDWRNADALTAPHCRLQNFPQLSVEPRLGNPNPNRIQNPQLCGGTLVCPVTRALCCIPFCCFIYLPLGIISIAALEQEHSLLQGAKKK